MLLVGRHGLMTQPPSEYTLTYTTSANGANLWADANTAGYAGEDILNVVINGGVQIGSTSTGTPGMTIDTTYSGKEIRLTNGGTINGRGGAGGSGAGGTGGKALYVNASYSGGIKITNNGEINGGGGGGGGGGLSRGRNCISGKGTCTASCCSAGGGVGGRGYGNAAQVGGSAGGCCGTGCGGGSCGGPVWKCGGTGGTGGAKGATGNTGGGGTNAGGCSGAGGGASGGAAGAAVDGDSKINWETLGTINGSRIN